MAEWIDAHEAFDVAADLFANGATAGARAEVVEHAFANTARAMIAARAPKASGDYADSFYVKGSEVGTDKPQGFRLELGFHGTDRDGRVVSQSPRPHVGPVADALGEQFERAVGSAVVPD